MPAAGAEAVVTGLAALGVTTLAAGIWPGTVSFVLLLKLNALGVEAVAPAVDPKLNKVPGEGAKVNGEPEAGVPVKDCCSPPVLAAADEIVTAGANAGLKTGVGFTVTLGAAVTLEALSDACGGEVGGLKVTTGGPGLPLSVDLKTNSVLHCGFLEDVWASAVAAISAALAMAFAALFSAS